MYIGFHPNFHPPSVSERIAANVGGTAVTWFRTPAKPDQPALRYDTVFSPISGGRCPSFQKVHMWVFADDLEKLRPILNAASAIQFPRSPPRSPAERYDVGRMALVATKADGDAKTRWAEFLDPAGRYHRVRIGGRIGKDLGRVKRITATSVTVYEVYQDKDCEWSERTRVLKKVAAMKSFALSADGRSTALSADEP